MNPINLLDLFEYARRHGLRLLLWGLAVGLAGFLVCFLIPSTYRAVAVILPPDDDELTASLSMTRRNLGGLSGLGRLGTYFTQADIALAILRSRSVAELVAQHFDLQKVYGTKDLASTVDKLRDRVKVRISTDGTISVAVDDGNAERSAALANQFLAELDKKTQYYRSSRARRTRQFLEMRVAETDSSLRAAERVAAAYQKRSGTLLLTPETQAAMNGAASLMSQKIAAETQLELVKQYSSPSSDEVRSLEARVAELRRQFGQVPTTQVGGAALIRDIAIRKEVLSILMPQLEESRISEAMDTPTIQILDPALPPTHRSWPRRGWITAFGFVLGILAGLAEPALRSARAGVRR